ncbi:hypothetical protein SKAU_G00324130 [Synaphobranchus kaupii]|uniref:Uncharacterized protein n=1 Tax=Synaphobranchus kaupii TaxID=118154 RepID=A0A9Q1EP86_SYNKA|nr:hypothetical protein SKAU_G00324130 [Synaphobranchus kaupii]
MLIAPDKLSLGVPRPVILLVRALSSTRPSALTPTYSRSSSAQTRGRPPPLLFAPSGCPTFFQGKMVVSESGGPHAAEAPDAGVCSEQAEHLEEHRVQNWSGSEGRSGGLNLNSG